MTVGEANMPDLNRHTLLARLANAEITLRAGLNQSVVEALVRSHIERALAHLREAEIALQHRVAARAVTELADQLARIEAMRADLHAQETGLTTLHV